MSDPGLVADRVAVIELCQRPHWIYDHAAWDELDHVFMPVVAMPTVAQAREPGFDEDAYLDDYLVPLPELKRALAQFSAGLLTQHLVAGHHVRLGGDTAVCRAHSINMHLRADAAGHPLAHGNEYRFDCVRTPEGWRIRGWIPWVRWSWGDASTHNAEAKQAAWRPA